MTRTIQSIIFQSILATLSLFAVGFIIGLNPSYKYVLVGLLMIIVVWCIATLVSLFIAIISTIKPETVAPKELYERQIIDDLGGVYNESKDK